MCIFSRPKMASVSMPEPDPAPTADDKAIIAARDAERRRRAQSGQKSTLLTQNAINTNSSVVRKTLLGQ